MTNPPIIPITEARKKLGNLSDQVAINSHYIIFTKGGKPQTALVNIDYFNRLQEEVHKIYGRTFIDPKLLPFTRIFSDKEIKKWQEEDKL